MERWLVLLQCAKLSGEKIVQPCQRIRWDLLVAAICFLASTSAALGQEALSAFMKAKLVHAEKTLEGLVKEDFELVAKHSQAISLLCEDESWMVLKTPEYQARSNEFRRSVNAITEAARKKNLEAATLAYVDATLKCVSCHQHVRQTQAKR